MAAVQGGNMMPIVSKIYCSPSETVLVVRRRPNVVNGGGFVVADRSQRVVFKVDGCGVIGRKEELVVKDGDENPLLLIRRKGSIVEALSITRNWKGFSYDNFSGYNKLVFTLKQPNSCFINNIPIRISIEAKDYCTYGNIVIRGSFPDRSCSIVSSRGDVIAEVCESDRHLFADNRKFFLQIGLNMELGQVMTSRDLYNVTIKSGIDQAFIMGVIAVLDYIYDGSTRC